MIIIDRAGSVAPDKYDRGGWFVDLRLWIRRPAFLLKLRRVIVRAAPTCTLWVPMFHMDALQFRFNKRWIITHREYVELR